MLNFDHEFSSIYCANHEKVYDFVVNERYDMCKHWVQIEALSEEFQLF